MFRLDAAAAGPLHRGWGHRHGHPRGVQAPCESRAAVDPPQSLCSCHPRRCHSYRAGCSCPRIQSVEGVGKATLSGCGGHLWRCLVLPQATTLTTPPAPLHKPRLGRSKRALSVPVKHLSPLLQIAHARTAAAGRRHAPDPCGLRRPGIASRLRNGSGLKLAKVERVVSHAQPRAWALVSSHRTRPFLGRACFWGCPAPCAGGVVHGTGTPWLRLT